MYNVCMKKISVLVVGALLLSGLLQNPAECGFVANYKARIEQNKVQKSTINSIKSVIEQQDVFANKHDLKSLKELYSPEFVNSDGFEREVYFKMIDETWKSYPDISYKTKIKNIDYTDNYATVLVEEISVSAPVEHIGEFDTIGELYSVAKGVYHLEKQGKTWKIISEKVIDETSTLKFGEARYIDIELNVPKQIGSGKSYTATLKVNAPEDATLVASISQEKMVYPQVKAEDAFRKISDSVLERVFTANRNNVNEYAVASLGITHAKSYDEEHIRIYMSGMAFLMTRVNVIPENKFVNFDEKDSANE